MFRNLTSLLFIYLLSGAVVAEQWVPMGAGKIYVGAKPVMRLRKMRSTVLRQ